MATNVTIESDKLPPSGHPSRRRIENDIKLYIGTKLGDAMITVEFQKPKRGK